MRKPLILIIALLVATLACGRPVTVGTLADKSQLVATGTATKAPVKIATKTPTAAPTPEKVFIYGSYNLRENPKGGGHAYGHVSNELVELLDTNDKGWMKIQVGKLTGWVSPSACRQGKSNDF